MSMYPKRSNVHVAEMLESPRSGMKAEAQVYGSLEKVFAHDSNVACLWSLAIPDSPRELDFLVVHKELGIATIEVKAIPLIPTLDGWMQFNPSTGEAWDSHRQEPDRQLGAATSAVKKWWAMESRGQWKNPRNIKVLVLAGTDVKDLPKDSGLACADTLWRQKAGTYIICCDEIEHLPYLLLDRLKSQNPANVTQDTAAFFEAAKSLYGSCGASPSLDQDAGAEPRQKPRFENEGPQYHTQTETRERGPDLGPLPLNEEVTKAKATQDEKGAAGKEESWLTWSNVGKAAATVAVGGLTLAGLGFLVSKKS